MADGPPCPRPTGQSAWGWTQAENWLKVRMQVGLRTDTPSDHTSTLTSLLSSPSAPWASLLASS